MNRSIVLSPATINVLRRRLVLVLSVLILLNSGCVFRQKESVRAASFHPHAGTSIGQTDIDTYLRSRVALLVSSDQNPTNRWAVGDMRLPEGGSFGCAVAIDRRGYFLTAAHCLKREFVYLLLYDSQTTRALRARVVWVGKKREKQQDLAVLHVQQALTHTFAWTDGVCSDEPAMAVGLSRSRHEIKGFALLGGKILASQELAGEAGGFRIASAVPTQSGDSGGPLVDTRGRLIGINTRATPPLVHRLLPSRVFPMVADRPNQTWLSQIIEADVAIQKTRFNRNQGIGPSHSGREVFGTCRPNVETLGHVSPHPLRDAQVPRNDENQEFSRTLEGGEKHGNELRTPWKLKT